ncbi:hypothetical protein A9Q81_09275 [Gammaproteobacteria bacterium 42_54_T18]|nr:hypothetical protein A9Q81_09275 [Gammaproteobacteria bacterium 42_54_T18]
MAGLEQVNQSDECDSLVGRELNGAYRIERQLADGGMSLVFIAEQISLGRKVVVKVLRPGFDDEDFIQLFLREARINSQVNHPSVVSVFDFGRTDDGIVFIAMELLDGVTLGDVVESEGALPVGNVVWLMEQVCAGIHAAHKLDVVHRDLKPNNIMIVQVTGGDTLVKVLDFGISKPLGEEDLKHTKLGMVMGTPGYLSPEQIRGVAVDPRADVYALGALLFFVLSGKRPFSGASHESIMAKQLSGDVPKLLDVSVTDPLMLSLQPVVDQAMALDRDMRYADVKVFWQALLDHSKQFEKVVIDGEGGRKSQDSSGWNVISNGGLIDGVIDEDVKIELQRVLKMSEGQAKQLIETSKNIVIRKNLNEKDAQRFKTVFSRIGLRVSVVSAELGGVKRDPGSLPTPGMVQPMTLTQLQRAGRQQLQSSSLVQSNLSGGSFENQRVGGDIVKATSVLSKRIYVFLCVALLMVGFGVGAYSPWRYHVSDIWVRDIIGEETPRGVMPHQITIGMSAAFQGGAKELGRAMRLGVEAYFHRVNATGGIHGRALELNALNDGYEPGIAIKNMAAFVDKESGVFSLLGNVGTPTARAILPIALKERMLVMGTFSGAEVLRNDPPDRYVFNYRASYAEETAAMIHYFVKVKKLRPERIGVFYQNDSYGRDGLSGVVDALQDYGVARENIITASYERNTVQVETAVHQFDDKIDSLDAVVLVSTYSASAAFTRLVREQGFLGEVGNVSFVGARALAEAFQEIGGGIGEDVLVTQVVPMYDSYASGVLQYREDFSRYFPNEEPGFVSLEGYIVAVLLCEALQQVGRYFTMDDVVSALESFSSLELGVGQPLSFHVSDHQASHQVWGSRITAGGAFEEVDLKKVRL